MSFQSLLVSKDDEAISVLTPVLLGFGLEVETCAYADALCRLTEQKLDAVLVDFDDPHSAALVLRNASAGKSGVTVALLRDKNKVRHVFGAGANFILYKPLSKEQAEATLLAATALIKWERRRSFRVPVQIPLHLHPQNGSEVEGILLDLSEDGMDLLASQPLYPSAPVSARFTLPGESTAFEIHGETAWANPNGQAGVCFTDLSQKDRTQLRSWLFAHAVENPPEDPEPLSACKLTDLSIGGCYVETQSPFPERSGLSLSLKAGDIEVQAEGVVRVMHPGYGMGIEFASRTEEQRERVSEFIRFLTGNPDNFPRLLITPCSFNDAADSNVPIHQESEELDDPLLDLLRSHQLLNQEEFLQRLRGQRSAQTVAG